MKASKVLSVTQARDQFFDLINAARYSGQVTEVRKSGKLVAKIVPVDIPIIDWEKKLKWLKSFKPFLTDEDVKDMEKTRKGFKTRFPNW